MMLVKIKNKGHKKSVLQKENLNFKVIKNCLEATQLVIKIIR